MMFFVGKDTVGVRRREDDGEERVVMGLVESKERVDVGGES